MEVDLEHMRWIHVSVVVAHMCSVPGHCEDEVRSVPLTVLDVAGHGLQYMVASEVSACSWQMDDDRKQGNEEYAEDS